MRPQLRLTEGPVRQAANGHRPLSEAGYRGADPGISELVRRLNKQGVTTLESCQGGPGHPYPVPWIRISGHNDRNEIERALKAQNRRILRLSRNRDIEIVWYEGDDRPTRHRRAAWNLWLEP